LIVMPARGRMRPLRSKGVLLGKEAMIEMEGTVQEVLPNTQFRVRLTNGADVLAYAGGKMRQRRIRIIAGDRVSLEMSPYDVTRGRINYRHLDSAPPVGVKRRFPFKRR
jgi:translation initiation factor IF-1